MNLEQEKLVNTVARAISWYQKQPTSCEHIAQAVAILKSSGVIKPKEVNNG